MDSLIEQTAERIVADHREHPRALWKALIDNGLAGGLTRRADGSTDLSIVDGFGLMRIAAAAATAVPFSQTLLASWVLGLCGTSAPEGAGSILPSAALRLQGNTVDATFAAVEFGAELHWLACLQDNGELLLLPAPSSSSRVESIHDDPSADMIYQSVDPLAQVKVPPWLNRDTLQLLHALMRSAQLCGAMESALDLTVDFAAQREQFGRSLSKFQAIQHMLSEMAGEVSASIAALDAAIEQVGGSGAEFLSAASAKARASEAAGIVGAHAHQVHGAIGYTQEYALARLSRRLWRWRDDAGDETYWAAQIGRSIVAAGSPAFSELVFGKTPALKN